MADKRKKNKVQSPAINAPIAWPGKTFNPANSLQQTERDHA